ncbi:MAG: hypothetical protein RLZ28_53 [Actinomycetota bacterium]|jgi:uncharacterized protein YoxC
MSGGEIAAIIAASAFALFVIALVPTLVKTARLVDEARFTMQSVNEQIDPLLTELTETLAVVNTQVDRIDKITRNVSNVTANIDNMVDVFSVAVGSPLFKVAGIGRGIFRFLNNQKKRRDQR